VLGNLVDNALDAAGPGWVEVGFTTEDDPDHGTVRVTVRDSGPGVASELVEEVFRHGFSTKAAEHDTGGRGLGLALARQVCLRRGGTITLHDDGGRGDVGAVFTACLPLAPAQVPA
jgi:signal transduction histidine kinase